MAHWECLVARSLQETHLADVVAAMVVDIALVSDGKMLGSQAMARREKGSQAHPPKTSHLMEVVPSLVAEAACVPYWQMRSSQAGLHWAGLGARTP